jgi:NADP-dependent 3-hydroxy acid dehydrogenase YdfG
MSRLRVPQATKITSEATSLQGSRTQLIEHLDDVTRDAARHQVSSIEALRPEDVADAIAYIVTRERRVAVNELLIRASDQTW